MKNKKRNANDLTRQEREAVLRQEEEHGDGGEDNCFALASKYGTYEVQATGDTDCVFPAIAQGLSKDWKFDRPRPKEPDPPKAPHPEDPAP